MKKLNENIKVQSRSQFKNIHPLKEILSENIHYLHILEKIVSGELDDGIIAQLPNGEGDLHIDHFKTSNIFEKHGVIPLENMIITATEPTTVIKGVIDKKPYITLIYEFERGGFVLSTRKFNSHYVVTFFEPSDTNYIKSVKNRGEVIFDQKKTP